MARFRFLIFLAFASLTFAAGFGGRKGPLVLEQADILRNITRDTEQIRILINNVKFSQEDIHIRCDYAEFYSEARRAYMRGNVFVQDSTQTLTADEVNYYEITGVAEANGNVKVVQPTGRTIYCRRLNYNYDTGISTYRGAVVFVDSARRTTVTGEMATYDEILHEADVTVTPKLVKKDSTGQHPITVTGKRLWTNDSLKQARVEADVVVTQDTLQATGGYLVLDDSTGVTVLTKSPKLVRGKEVMVADSMRFKFVDDRLNDMVAIGSVVALSPADSTPDAPLNRITGMNLHSFFDKGEANRILVWGNAKSRYYIRDNAKDNGVNVASGDTLDIGFVNKEIDAIRVVGGVEGVYYPIGWKREIEDR